MTSPVVDLADLAGLLGVDERQDGLARRVLRASRVVSPGFAAYVLSVVALSGPELSAEGARELQRIVDRADALRAVADLVADLEPQVCKGSTIAACYPDGTRRHVGDVDLCLPSAAAVWTAAVRIAAERPVERVSVQTIADQVAISLSWSAPDPLYEADLHVDVFTTPYWGDGAGMPVRTYDHTLPPAVQSVMLLLEERCQRAWQATDFVDLAYLVRCTDQPELVRAAAPLGLSRWLGALLDQAVAHDIDGVVPLAPELGRPHDGAVRAVRGAVHVGLPLDVGPSSGAVEMIETDDVTLVHAPFGAFLMTSVADVTEEQVDRAEALLDDPTSREAPDVRVTRLSAPVAPRSGALAAG
ncbi:nucleotidyltransferase family protein [Cellulomonas terrae]|uniref:Nucleotidyltransferase n=1 Tax=Cellulomonas terrae TaxID=311234 RepID=A0A511JK26_9CELL|nr:nucleotidyltransferase family protein [Cellulomonas terrae]GEL98367.1 hypothetical protein CTE05_19140 [Cellulomonas terrae]